MMPHATAVVVNLASGRLTGDGWAADRVVELSYRMADAVMAEEHRRSHGGESPHSLPGK
jgi:hypothetical protein